MLSDGKKEMSLIPLWLPSSLTERLIPKLITLGLTIPSPSPYKLIHHCFTQVSMAHSMFLCYNI